MFESELNMESFTVCIIMQLLLLDAYGLALYIKYVITWHEAKLYGVSKNKCSLILYCFVHLIIHVKRYCLDIYQVNWQFNEWNIF